MEWGEAPLCSLANFVLPCSSGLLVKYKWLAGRPASAATLCANDGMGRTLADAKIQQIKEQLDAQASEEEGTNAEDDDMEDERDEDDDTADEEGADDKKSNLV